LQTAIDGDIPAVRADSSHGRDPDDRITGQRTAKLNHQLEVVIRPNALML